MQVVLGGGGYFFVVILSLSLFHSFNVLLNSINDDESRLSSLFTIHVNIILLNIK